MYEVSRAVGDDFGDCAGAYALGGDVIHHRVDQRRIDRRQCKCLEDRRRRLDVAFEVDWDSMVD